MHLIDGAGASTGYWLAPVCTHAHEQLQHAENPGGLSSGWRNSAGQSVEAGIKVPKVLLLCCGLLPCQSMLGTADETASAGLLVPGRPTALSIRLYAWKAC